jgi:hypothetical protein
MVETRFILINTIFSNFSKDFHVALVANSSLFFDSENKISNPGDKCWYNFVTSNTVNIHLNVAEFAHANNNVSHRLQSHVRSCGICGVQGGIGADFLRVIQFPF